MIAPVREEFSPALVHSSHWLAKISERCRVVEIQLVRGVVREHPWKHWVLGNVVVGTASNHIEFHEVLKVGDLPPTP